jgi:hypothetical protein
MARTADEIRAEIRAAFAARPYPGDDRLASGPSYSGDEGDENGDVERFFRGKDWREVTLDAILGGRALQPNSFLFFLSPEAFVYYLPAFLIASLDVALDVDNRFDLGEPLAFKLMPEREDHARITAQLTPAEKRAVAHALEHLAREYEKRRYTTNQAQAALDSAWGRFAKDL